MVSEGGSISVEKCTRGRKPRCPLSLHPSFAAALCMYWTSAHFNRRGFTPASCLGCVDGTPHPPWLSFGTAHSFLHDALVCHPVDSRLDLRLASPVQPRVRPCWHGHALTLCRASSHTCAPLCRRRQGARTVCACARVQQPAATQPNRQAHLVANVAAAQPFPRSVLRKGPQLLVELVHERDRGRDVQPSNRLL